MLHGGACPLCKNPPIYTVLNAAFSAPHPPLGGTSAQSAPPEGSRGPPRPPDPVPKRGPRRTLPERLLHVALADVALYIFFIYKLKLYVIFAINIAIA